jgi:hypothetical protein
VAVTFGSGNFKPCFGGAVGDDDRKGEPEPA